MSFLSSIIVILPSDDNSTIWSGFDVFTVISVGDVLISYKYTKNKKRNTLELYNILHLITLKKKEKECMRTLLISFKWLYIYKHKVLFDIHIV